MLRHYKCLAFTYNRKSTNFSSTHGRICVKDATPLLIQQYLANKKSLVGINTLNRILPDMLCGQAGLKRKTSHCLRVTCATRLFQHSVDEKWIRERTDTFSLIFQRQFRCLFMVPDFPWDRNQNPLRAFQDDSIPAIKMYTRDWFLSSERIIDSWIINKFLLIISPTEAAWPTV